MRYVTEGAEAAFLQCVCYRLFFFFIFLSFNSRRMLPKLDEVTDDLQFPCSHCLSIYLSSLLTLPSHLLSLCTANDVSNYPEITIVEVTTPTPGPEPS